MSSIYLSTLEQNSGSLSISIVLMKLLKQKFHKVAFFRPIVDKEDDNDIEFILEYFKLQQNKNDSYGFLVDDIQKLFAQNQMHKVYEQLIEKFEYLKQNYDFVFIQGLSKDRLNSTIDFDINLKLVNHFNSSLVVLLNGENKTIDKIDELIKLEDFNIQQENCNHIATIVNKLDKNNYDILIQKDQDINYLKFMIPKVEPLNKLTMSDIKDTLKCEMIFGNRNNLNQKINDIKIASMGLENYFNYIKKGNLIIVSGDRSDIVLGSLSAIYSHNMPHIAGIVLTGGLKPNKQILNLLDGFKNVGICILSVKTDTYQTSLDIQKIQPSLSSKSYSKIAMILGEFSKYIDETKFIEALDIKTSNIVTPIMFEFNLFQRAKQNKQHIVLNESDDDRILRACEILLYQDIVDISLIGDKQTILHRANILGIDLTKANIINPATSKLTQLFIDEFYKLRKSKGILYEEAEDTIKNSSIYFATMMVQLGYANGLVSGALTTTANTVRPALQIIKTKPNIDIISSIFFMCFDTKVLAYGDCAINRNPTSKELAQIALSSAYTSKQFGLEPKVAMLSYSTGDSGMGEDVEKIKEATLQANKLDSSIIIEGPIQYDAAINKEVALKKLPNSKLKGEATVLIFPDLNTGNNTYKAVQRSSKAIAIGPILQGLNKPVNDLSRGCKVVDIINTVAITAIQAQGI